MNELLAAIKIYLSACERQHSEVTNLVYTVYKSPSAALREQADNIEACDRARFKLHSLIDPKPDGAISAEDLKKVPVVLETK